MGLCASKPEPQPQPRPLPALAVREYPVWDPPAYECNQLSARVGVRRINMAAANALHATREPEEIPQPGGWGWSPAPPAAGPFRAPPALELSYDVTLLPGRVSWDGGKQFFLLLRSHVILPDMCYRQISIAPRGGGESLVLTFDGSQPALAAEWLEALRAKQMTCYLLNAEGKVLDDCFESMVHDCLTRSFVGVNGTALRKFYYEGSPGSRYITQALLDSFRVTLGAEPAGGEAAEIFARFLKNCFELVALRVFFLAFSFPPGASVAAATPTSSRAYAFDAMVKSVLEAENGHWPAIVGPRLLVLADFPSAERDGAHVMGSNKELEWLRLRLFGSPLRSTMLSLPATLGFAPEALLPYLLDKNGRNIVGVFLLYAAATDADHALNIVRKLDVTWLDDSVLLKLLMHTNMHGERVFGCLCDLLVAKNLLSQELFERLCQACFEGNMVHLLEQFVLLVMLEQEAAGAVRGGAGSTSAGGARDAPGAQVSARGAKALLRFSHIFIERMAQVCDPVTWSKLRRGPVGSFKVNCKATSIKKLLEVALLLEQKNAEGGDTNVPGMSMATLSSWVLESSLGTERTAKATCLGKVFDDSTLASYLAALLSANKLEFDDLTMASLGGSMAELNDVAWAQRGRHDLINAIFGFLSLGLEVQPEDVQLKLFKDLLRDPTASASFFHLLGPAGKDGVLGILRPRLVTLLQRRHGILESFKVAALTRVPPILFTCSEHFSHSVLDVMRMGSKSLSQELFTNLALAGIKLREYAGLGGENGRLRSMERFLSSENEYVGQLTRIVDCILERPEADFFVAGKATLTLEGAESVTSCVTDAASALGELSGKARDKMQNIINSKLKSNPPSAWPSIIKGLGTVALFLKYINLERLELAHSAYATENTEAKGVSANIVALVERVRASYLQPMVPAENIPSDFDNSSFERIMDGLRAQHDASLRSTDTSARDVGLLAKISAEWMKKTLKDGVAIAPRNVQSILYLVAAQWLRGQHEERQRGAPCKALMGTMGTGEGKSLAFAMLASFAVKQLGLKVHILENTASLKHRDFEDNKDFYEFMGITVGESNGDAFPGSQVTYCLRSDLEAHYRNTIADGTNADGGANNFKQTLLLVDEVDSVIVCEHLALRYLRNNEELSRGLVEAYRAAASGIKPAGVTEATWQHAKNAREQFRLRNPKEIAEFGGKWCVKDQKGQPDGLLHYDMDWYNVSLGRDAHCMVGAPWYLSSLPYIFSRYSCLVGLSGSLGGSAERDYLKSAFQADFVTVPNFLNTCEGTKKCQPALCEEGVQVVPDEAALQSKVVELAMSFRSKVPVVIICGAQTERCSALSKTLKGKSSSLGDKAVLEITGYGLDKAKIKEFVELATKPLTDTTTAKQAWPVTVTDYEGGRGHDFRVSLKAVDLAGGLLVIITEIPAAGEREWVQWKGRTARSDRMGQYAIVLSRADEALRISAQLLQAAPLRPNIYDITLAEALLKVQDDKLRAKLATAEEESKRGKELNALCDAFYARYRAARGGLAFDKGPWFPEQLELSRVIDSGQRDFAEFRRRHGLPPA